MCHRFLIKIDRRHFDCPAKQEQINRFGRGDEGNGEFNSYCNGSVIRFEYSNCQFTIFLGIIIFHNYQAHQAYKAAITASSPPHHASGALSNMYQKGSSHFWFQAL